MWVSREDKLIYDGATGKLDEKQAAKTHGILIVKNCIYGINETGVRHHSCDKALGMCG